jgi:phage terminase small subunit
MADLENPRWEAFAQARARSLNMTAAYKAAGYKTSRGAASRLNKKPPVEARLGELLVQREALREARIEETIVALVAMAAVADLKNGAGLKEARAARLEAHRLGGLLTQRQEEEAWTPPRRMTTAEWVETFVPKSLAARE